MIKVMGLTFIVWVICVACTFAGLKIGIDGTELRIAQDCAADGWFVIERDGTPWHYTCSKPRLVLGGE